VRLKLVAFTGPAGAGKSSAAKALVEDEGWRLVKFADPLKSMLRALYRFVDVPDDGIEARIEGRLKEVVDPILMGLSPRHAMQTLGTEWGRDAMHPDLWVTLWKRRAWQLMDRGVGVVVDDCRFANEAAAVRELGGLIVRINGRSQGLSAEHPSERIDLQPDVTILNDGDVRDLWQRALEFAT